MTGDPTIRTMLSQIPDERWGVIQPHLWAANFGRQEADIRALMAEVVAEREASGVVEVADA
ncbi:hypothetical protein ABC347_07875 [Sphingomonas sp. 1P06PA]|uniref:hypothetical protein n=1 Tax=Sphingomonas sp. 1P06PA TaxID=554121 RepID=UPI0039A752CE